MGSKLKYTGTISVKKPDHLYSAKRYIKADYIYFPLLNSLNFVWNGKAVDQSTDTYKVLKHKFLISTKIK